MCKHILGVQFILIDRFQEDLSKKKIYPPYTYTCSIETDRH